MTVTLRSFYDFRVRLTAMMSRALPCLVAACLSAVAMLSGAGQVHERAAQPPMPWVIAHRGASAHAPENTVPAFRLAADQGATFVEFDVRLTKDRQVVCLHDDSLERTTDVEKVFPSRGRGGAGTQARARWPLEDFTLAELKTLDAGSWFNASFRGTRIPTFKETIEALRGRSGLFIELKSPERYKGLEQLVLDELKAHGLDVPGADARTPVLLQSFTASSLQIFAQRLKTRLPIHFLVSARDAGPWMTADGLNRMKAFASGISPEKVIVKDYPGAMARARKLGMLVTPYTFRASAVPGFADVRAEMAYYLDVLAVNGVITDNPDQAPARRRSISPTSGGQMRDPAARPQSYSACRPAFRIPSELRSVR
jgi:glycerophosphoryl diester phosphodiesterase